MTAHVVSDLHLLSRRSRFGEFENEMLCAARASDLLILNGDVFDFKWSTHGSLDASIPLAISWLEALMAAAPDCRVAYVLGNHDAVAPFATELEILAERQPLFQWHPTHLQFDTALFHHGDLLLHSDPIRHWQRTLDDAVAVKGEFRNVVYDATIKTRLHRAPELLNRPGRVARRVVTALRASTDPRHATVTDLYVGHTHLPFAVVEVDGIRVHNTGSAIKHLQFNMLRLSLNHTPLAG
jgi:UDP-2,3-diacylglucosamine hydrolase